MKAKIIFLGSDPIALPLLDALAQSPAQLLGVFTQPDRPHGRGQKCSPGEIKTWAMGRNLPIFQPEKKPGKDEIAWIYKNQIDLAIVLAYGHLLTQAFLDAPRHGVINVHASLLPAYRGPSPIETAVAMGENQTGLSLMRLVLKMDAGPVMAQTTLPIHPEDTSAQVRQRMAVAAPQLVLEALRPILSNNAVFIEQDHAQATYCRMLTRADGAIDWNLSAQTLDARIRGFTPWPGAYTYTSEGLMLKIGSAQDLEAPCNAAPGTLLAASDTGLYVATAQGTLCLKNLQRPGAKMLPAGLFLRGFPMRIGSVFGGSHLAEQAPLSVKG